jgi:hypothetical protein
MITAFEAARTQKRIKESFEQAIREYWPLDLILEARSAIEAKNYRELDKILSRLDDLR